MSQNAAARALNPDDVRLFFSAPRTISRFVSAFSLTRPAAERFVTRWVLAGHLFSAGKTLASPFAPYPGRPAALFCVDRDVARAALGAWEEYTQHRRPVLSPIRALAAAVARPPFFAVPRTAEVYASSLGTSLDRANELIQTELDQGTLYFAGECTREGISKKGQPYLRAVSAMFCADKSLAVTSTFQWAARLWCEAGCPED